MQFNFFFFCLSVVCMTLNNIYRSVANRHFLYLVVIYSKHILFYLGRIGLFQPSTYDVDLYFSLVKSHFLLPVLLGVVLL